MKNKYLLLLCASFLFSAAPLRADNQADAYYHYVMGSMKENARDYDGAIDEYRLALKSDPDSSEIFSHLAALYIQTDKMDEAVQDAKRAIEKNADNEEAHKMLGQIYMQKIYVNEGTPQDLQNAIHEFQEVTRIDPDDDPSILTLAQLYLQNNQPQPAAEILSKYLEDNSDSPSAVMGVASAYEQMNQPAKAIPYVEKFLAEKPDNLFVLQQAAELYEKTGNIPQAVEMEKRAYEGNEDNPTVFRNYLDLLLKNQQADEAVRLLEPKMKDDVGDPEWATLFAKALQRSGKQDRAEKIMKDVLAKDPSFDSNLAFVQIYEEGQKYDDAIHLLTQMQEGLSDGDTSKAQDEITSERALIYSHIGYSLQQKKDYEAAIDAYRKARTFVSSKATGRVDFYIALNQRNLKKYDDAIETINGITAQDANDTDAWELLSLVYEEKGDTANSDRVLQHLVDTHPDSATYFVMKAERMQQRQKYEDSISYLKDLLPKFPQNDQILFLLGAGNERLKRMDQAEEYFKQAIAANPDNANALNYLGYMLVDRGVRLEESLEYIKKAIEIDHDNGAFLDSLGWAYFKLDRLNLAEDNLRMATQKMNENATVHDHMGDLYFKLGKFRDAIQQWELALQFKDKEIDPAYIQKKIDDTKSRIQ